MFLKQSGVEGVGVWYEILRVFESKDRREGRAAKRFEKFVKPAGPKPNDDVIFGRDIGEGGGNTWGERYFEEVMYRLRQAKCSTFRKIHKQ